MIYELNKMKNKKCQDVRIKFIISYIKIIQ